MRNIKNYTIFIILLFSVFKLFAQDGAENKEMNWIQTANVKTTLNQTVSNDDGTTTTIWQDMMARHLQTPYLTQNDKNGRWFHEIKLNGSEMAYYYQNSVSMDQPGADFLTLHYIQLGGGRNDYGRIYPSPPEKPITFSYEFECGYIFDQSWWNKQVDNIHFSDTHSLRFTYSSFDARYQEGRRWNSSAINDGSTEYPVIRKVPFLELSISDLNSPYFPDGRLTSPRTVTITIKNPNYDKEEITPGGDNILGY